MVAASQATESEVEKIGEEERKNHIREMMTVMQEEEWWEAMASNDPDSETMSREASLPPRPHHCRHAVDVIHGHGLCCRRLRRRLPF